MSDAVRDYSKRPAVVKAVENARDVILASWGEWNDEAEQDAQREQDGEAWFAAMTAQLECVLYGMLDQIPAMREEAARD